jgi:hypothetical protein
MIFPRSPQLLDHKSQFVGIILQMNYFLIQMPLLMAPQLYLNQRLGGINDVRSTDVKKPPSGGFFV